MLLRNTSFVNSELQQRYNQLFFPLAPNKGGVRCHFLIPFPFCFIGLVKILKKYDKRTGGLLRLPFTQFALRQPFFTTEHVTRLVRECEENLELLFPLEAEVFESDPCAQDQSKPPPCNAANISPETSSTLGEETVDLYRSTLAAMKAIKGLQKESSTSNPLSFSSLFRNQDDESTGAVTAENSASNSSASLNNGEEGDQEDYPSV